MTRRQVQFYAFGLGYSALRLARAVTAAGGQAGGTVRTPRKAAQLQAEGIAAAAWPDGEAAPPPGAHWLVSVPPDGAGCPVARAFAGQAWQAASVTYLSTTGVYGDLGGGWAFEWSPARPGSERARWRMAAEQDWQAARDDVRIVRLPGIYGPGRSVFDRLRAGDAQRIIKRGQVFSRVHVDDIVSGLMALIERPVACGVFHLCDDLPAPPQDVVAHGSRLLGMAPPPEVAFDAARLSPMARSFYAECKRVSNARAKAALGWRPAWPTYREGLAAILAAGG